MTISVVSPEIVLKDKNGKTYNLNTFKLNILLYCGQFGSSGTLEVRALKPNYPLYQGRSGYTPHPHVNGNSLRMGQGSHAFKRATATGKLLDAIDVVIGVLDNYSPDSPYARLEEWQGHECTNCGTRNAYRPTTCPACRVQVCNQGCDRGECYATGYTYHKQCMTECPLCKRKVGTGTLTKSLDGTEGCSQCVVEHYMCRKMVVAKQIDRNTGRCPHCPQPKPSTTVSETADSSKKWLTPTRMRVNKRTLCAGCGKFANTYSTCSCGLPPR